VFGNKEYKERKYKRENERKRERERRKLKREIRRREEKDKKKGKAYAHYVHTPFVQEAPQAQPAAGVARGL
jgi:hypothetical protein